MLSKALIDRARAVLPACRTLSEAEEELGGGMTGGDDQRRDWNATAKTWGLLDGHQGRPAVWNDGQHEPYKAAYHEAYAVGQRIAKEETKPCPTPAA